MRAVTFVSVGLSVRSSGPGGNLAFQVLGRLRLTVDAQPVQPPSPRLSGLLGALLLTPGRPVSDERLLTFVWGPDHGSRRALHSAVTRLRAWCDDHLHMAEAVARDDGGYRVDVPNLTVDVSRFWHGLRLADESEDASERVKRLRVALDEWSGPVMGGVVEGVSGDRVVADLESVRLERACQLADLALGTDLPAIALPPIAALAAERPYDEPLHARLIRLHAANGRRAEALRLIERFRRTLADELGVDPATEITATHAALLAAADTSAPEPGPDPAPSPAELPADIVDFTGREALVDSIAGYLAGPRAGLPIVALSGQAGVGKTALAVHVAHALRTRFPGGQFFVHLSGTGPGPADTDAVLGRFLRSLGVEGCALPDSTEERVARFRTLLADRQALMILDDAAAAAQVRPLLPGSTPCAVIVTSRRPLAGLEGALHVKLDVFEPSSAIELLGRIITTDRTAAEPESATEIVRLCGCLPLAVRVAASRLATRPRWTLARLAGLLGDELRRMDELVAEDLEVRRSVALSYQGLSPVARRALRLLGLLDAADVAVWVVAALLDGPVDQAAAAVDELTNACLLNEIGDDATGGLRYGLHELIRCFAQEACLAEDTGADRRAALGRALGAWLHLAEQAERRLQSFTFAPIRGTAGRWRPPYGVVDELLQDPRAWFQAEHNALESMIIQACEHGLDEPAWELCTAVAGFFERHDIYDSALRVHDRALAACEKAGNRLGVAVLARNLAGLWTARPNADRQVRLGHARTAVRIFEDMSEWAGLADALSLCADVHRTLGTPSDALSCVQSALNACRAAGYRPGEVHALLEIAIIHYQQGNQVLTRRYAEHVLNLARELGSRRDVVTALRLLGAAHRESGDNDRSRACLEEALSAAEAAGDRVESVYILAHLGELCQRSGDPDARRTLDKCLRLSRQYNLEFGEGTALRVLGRLDLAAGEVDRALDRLIESHRILRNLRHAAAEAEALLALGDAYKASGRPDAAVESWRSARTLFQAIQNPNKTAEATARVTGITPAPALSAQRRERAH